MIHSSRDTQNLHRLFACFAASVVYASLSIAASPSTSMPPSDCVTLQGRLILGGVAVEAPAPGGASFQFSLYDSDTGSTVVAGPVAVDNIPVRVGLFQVAVDFGIATDGTDRWIEIATDLPFDESTPFVTLEAKQGLGRIPVAEFALNGPMINVGGDFVFAGGNVDIGTNFPGQALVVAGDTLIAGDGVSGGLLTIATPAERKVYLTHTAAPLDHHGGFRIKPPPRRVA